MFDGNGDYLNLAANADLNFGTGDFTIAGWFFWKSTANTAQSLVATGHTGYATGVRFLSLNSTDKKLVFGGYTADLGAFALLSSAINSLVLNTWYHFEVSRAAGTIRMFLDGALVATVASSASFDYSASGTNVGRNGWNGTAGYYNGHLDDLIMVKGEALHTAAFSRPTEPYALPDNTPSGIVSIPLVVNVHTAGSLSLPVSVSVHPMGVASVALPVQIAPFGVAALGIDVSVLPASILSGADSVCVGAGNAAAWTPVVTLDGVDITAQAIGAIRVEAEEGAARIAEVTIRPESGTALYLPDWTGRRLTIDVADNATGAPRWPMRLFTGLVDVPSLDLNSRTITLSATDDLQGVCDGMTQAALAALIGGRHSAAVFDAAALGWDYANDRLSTIPASLDISPLGALRLTPWAPKTTADLVLDGLIGDGSLAVSLAPRSALVNEVNISFGYRFPRVKAELHAISWEAVNMTGFAQYLLDGKYLPQRAAIEAAIEKAGGTIDSITYTPLPDEIIAVGSGFWSPGPNDDELCLGFSAAVSFDYAAITEEQHQIRVHCAKSIDTIGLRRESMSGALEGVYPDIVATETGIKLFKDGMSSIPPADMAVASLEMTTSAEVTLTPETNRESADGAMETLIDIAKARIWASHRGHSVSATVPLLPALDVDKTAALSDSGVTAQGKVRRVVHMMDADTGAATSEVALAICSVAGVGIVHEQHVTAAPAGTTTVSTPLNDSPTVVFLNAAEEDHSITITFPAVEEAERNASAIVLPSSYAATISEDVFTVTI